MIMLPLPIWPRGTCVRCFRHRLSAQSAHIRTARGFASSSSTFSYGQEEHQEHFDDVAGELRRRKRKADAKRRQYGASFVDHVLVTIRGGKGGSGAAALEASLRGPSAPSGGNGGQGGSVYLTTSPSLTSLASVSKRLVGGQGASGSGSHKHGRRGEDVLVTVPVGTIVRELRREGDEEKTLREEADLGLSEEEMRRRRWQRAFVIHPSAGGEVSTNEYVESEKLMKREGRWNTRTPTFDQSPPILLDLDTNISQPILLASGGQGGLGNPFFPSPRVASRGTTPPTQTFEFELKLLADVGLVGFPNAGKSTLLRALTGRKAEVAGYQFTTLNPQVGVVRVWDDGSWGSGSSASEGEGEGEVVEETWVEREREELARLTGEYLPGPNEANVVHRATSYGHEADDDRRSPRVERIRFTLSDNPGLLPLASENVGLGHSFLRSIERSPVLVYVLDLTRPSPADDLRVLKGELEAYKEGLSGRGGVVVLNKGDEVGEDEGREKVDGVREVIRAGEVDRAEGEVEVVVLSGKYGLGLGRLVEILAEKVGLARQVRRAEQENGNLQRSGSVSRSVMHVPEARTRAGRSEDERPRSERRSPRLGFGLKAAESRAEGERSP